MKACSICARADRAEIDKALVTGVSLRELETRHTGTTRSALDRHRKHIPSALTQAKQAERVADATSVLSRLERLLSRCESAFERTIQDRKSQGVAAAFAREIRACLELLAKLSGELKPGGTRVEITMATIQNLDISALTKEQVEAIYERVHAEKIGEIARMTDEELEGEIARLACRSIPAGRAAFLFDEETVPAPANVETLYRNDESLRQVDIRFGRPPRGWEPHRDAKAEDRRRMLETTWKRLTGSELGETVIGQYASIEIGFDLTEGKDRYRESWPKVSLRTGAPAQTENLLRGSVPKSLRAALPRTIEGA